MSSTNDVALDLAARGAPHGSFVLAEEQSAGKGRFGRRWESHRGGLYLSVVVSPEAGDPISLLPHVTAVAAAEAVIEASGLEVRLRWPNDLYVNGLKLGGILCEGSYRGSEPEAFVAGIGINSDLGLSDLPQAVRPRAVGLSEQALDVGALAVDIVCRFQTWWERRDPVAVVSRFRELSEGDDGRRIRVHPRDGEAYEATTCGIAADGGLVIRLDDDSERILYSEDVVQLRDIDER